MNFQQWEDLFQARQLSVPFEQATNNNYIDYHIAWFRTFFDKPEIHSWFYHRWTMFGCPPSVLPYETKDGWDFWLTNTPVDDTCTEEL